MPTARTGNGNREGGIDFGFTDSHRFRFLGSAVPDRRDADRRTSIVETAKSGRFSSRHLLYRVTRDADASRALRSLAAICLAASIGIAAQQPADEQKRVNDRLQTLRKEADDLATREKSLLVELRRLEVERDIRAEIQKDAQSALASATQDLADTTAHLDSLERRQATEIPGLEQRLVQLYKLGSGGYLRLLLSVDDVRDMGRAYRTVAALAALDRERVRAHSSTVQSLREVRVELEARRTRAAKLEGDARRATADAAGAVAARSALIDQIDARRDMNAKFVGELQTAQQKLTAAVSALPTTGSAISIRPFEGALDWPVAGRVIGRFGRDKGSRFGTAVAETGLKSRPPAGSRSLPSTTAPSRTRRPSPASATSSSSTTAATPTRSTAISRPSASQKGDESPAARSSARSDPGRRASRPCTSRCASTVRRLTRYNG